MNEQRRSTPDPAANLVTFCKVVIVVVFVYPLLHYALLSPNPSPKTPTPPPTPIAVNTTRPRPPPPPSCPLPHLQNVLRDLCQELSLRRRQCTPEDVHDLEKHKLPKAARNNTTGEPRGTIVGCVAAGLLLTSLGAAFLELYKAKNQTPAKATKAPISRKCSLADLTVLKHSRKELVRRESIMEIPESKPLGFRPPPLYRRCSFPVGPSEPTYGNAYNTYQESRRPSIESRRLSIIDSRRSSTVSVDCRNASIDAGRPSIDNESPERRHWSRLVHRH